MQYIHIRKLTSEQYEDLSNLIKNRLVIEDQDGLEVDYDVTDLKIDDDGVVYAPTGAMIRTEVSNSADDIPGGRIEAFTELTGYEPIYTILTNQ